MENRLMIYQIYEYVEGNLNSRECLIDAEKILEAKNLTSCRLKDVSSEYFDLFALCLQTSAPNDPPHIITGRIKRISNKLLIENFVCSCKTGPGGCCKHITAVLIYCNRNPITSFEKISTAEEKCLWEKVKNSAPQDYKPVPIQNLDLLGLLDWNQDSKLGYLHIPLVIKTSKERKQKGGKCVICSTTLSQSQGRKFHRFPKDPELSNKWALVCGKKWIISASANTRNTRYRICDKHFSDNQYISGNRNRLKCDAVPKGYTEPPIQLQHLKEGIRKVLQEKGQSSTTVNVKDPSSSAVLKPSSITPEPFSSVPAS